VRLIDKSGNFMVCLRFIFQGLMAVPRVHEGRETQRIGG